MKSTIPDLRNLSWQTCSELQRSIHKNYVNTDTELHEDESWWKSKQIQMGGEKYTSFLYEHNVYAHSVALKHLLPSTKFTAISLKHGDSRCLFLKI